MPKKNSVFDRNSECKKTTNKKIKKHKMKILALFRWFLGELPEFEQREHSNKLVWWVGVISGLGILFGEYHILSGNPMTRGLWRFTCHGVFSIVGLALFYSWLERAKFSMSKVYALLALCFVFIPIGIRIFGINRGGPLFLREHPEVFALVLLASLTCAGIVFWKEGVELKKWGISFGDWHWWLPRVGVVVAIMIPTVGAVMFLDPTMSDFYPVWKPARKQVGLLIIEQLAYGIDLLGWELFFRGFLLFGFARRGDPITAIWIQTFPFFILHGEKPYFELVTSLIGGVLSGWFCLRANSFVPLFLLHWVQIVLVSVLGFWVIHS
jgi:membrane protease YdiL (CAAX protease family)